VKSKVHREIRLHPIPCLAAMLLEGKVHDGETVVVTAGKNGLMFNGAATKKAA
jgi:hypothetical protein